MVDLADHDSLDELTDKQRDVVELKAENPDMTASEIDDVVGTNQYAYAIINEYDHLIKELRENDPVADIAAECGEPGQDANANGSISTEWGNGSFEGQPIDATMQYLSERDADVSEAAVTGETLTVQFELSPDDVEAALTSPETPDAVRQILVSRVVDEVFGK